MRSFKSLAIVAVASFVTACGGGGGSSSITPGAPKIGSPTQSHAKMAMVTVKFVKPAAKSKRAPTRHGKHRNYVSPVTEGASVNAVSSSGTTANDAAYYYDLSSSCSATGGGTTSDTCSITFPLAPDSYAITVSAYDTPQTALTYPAGNELSTDTESYTVAANTTNQFNFYLLALVQGFYVAPAVGDTRDTHYFGANGMALAALNATVDGRHRSETVMPSATPTASASPKAAGTAVYEALDPDGYPIDQYGGLYGWALAGPTPSASNSPVPFVLVASDNGDNTGCSTLPTGCFVAVNDQATAVPAPSPSASPSGAPIYFPNGGGAAPFPSSSPSSAASDETFTFTYYGGGGPGVGVETWTVAGGVPTGSGNPYYGTGTIPAVAGSAFTGTYTTPFVYLVPLYAYVTDGNGNAAGGSTNANPFYVWAAQYAPPDGQSLDGSAYTVSVDSPSTCEDANAQPLATVASTGTYVPGYGKVFEVTINGNGSTGSCLLDIQDGVDKVQYTAFIGTPNTSVAIPAPSSSPTNPQPYAKKR